MNVTLTSEGDKELCKFIQGIARRYPKEVKGETYAHALDIINEAKASLRDMASWDTGNLANSMMLELEKAGFTAKVGPDAPYGIFVEHGTRPHFPPPDALEGWAKRHGFDSAWPICIAISKRGTKERPFLIPAFMKIKGKYYNALKELLGK